jgi:branched-chain amino acid transport system ATP-binding protein
MKKETLSISNFSVKTEGKTVVDDITVTFNSGEVVALLGPNGAGKSEFVLALSGCLPDRTGSVRIGHTETINLAPEQIRALGIAVVPEGHQVFPGLTVMDNLQAASTMHDSGDVGKMLDYVFTIFPELKPLEKMHAGLLSGGQQQMVALAQAIICRPKFLLIDELSLGLAPLIIERLLETVRQLRDEGVGIILIEQFTQLALEIANHAILMNHGRLLFSGTSQHLQDNPEIIKNIYLGGNNPFKRKQ